MKPFRIFSIVLLLLTTSCVSINLQQPEPTSTATAETAVVETQRTTAIPTQASGLSEAVLRNSEFLSPSLGKAVKLVDGTFTGAVNGVELQATLQPGIQFGDLNGDSVNDAALLLAEKQVVRVHLFH
jgi:hypothetical protein